MAHAYRSLEDGQIVISDEPRVDLEALSRWETTDVDQARALAEAQAAEPAEPLDEDQARLIEFVEERGLTAAEVLAALERGLAKQDANPPVETPDGKENGAPDKSWQNADIEQWAKDNEVDLDGATKKDDMLAAIAEHIKKDAGAQS